MSKSSLKSDKKSWWKIDKTKLKQDKKLKKQN